MTVHKWLADWSSWGWPFFANHLWQATLISLVVFAVAALMGKGPVRARYAVCLIASARFALPSALWLLIAHSLGVGFSSLSSSTSPSNDGVAVFLQITQPIAQFEESGVGSQTARNHSEFLCALTVAWLAGIIILLVLWLSRRQRFRRAMRGAPACGATRERQALDRVRSWLGIKRDVRLSMHPGAVEPGVWGVWRPQVFLPESMAEQLSDPELEAVMLHEMVHVARWDNLIANLHRLLCCFLWFHPFVWMLDRLLLADREQACDEEVIRLGAQPEVYASSLVKVLRFCLGWSVPGASNATGSNLGRRVQRIMSKDIQVNISIWRRAAVGLIAMLVVALSIAAGLAQNEKPGAGPIGGVRGGVPGGVSGGVVGGIPGGAPGGVVGFVAEGQERIIERLDQAPEIAIGFRNSDKTPVLITEARVRAVPKELGPGDDFAVLPVVSLTSQSDRRIMGVTFELRNGAERRAYYEKASSPIEPHAMYISGAQKRFVILVGRPESWTLRVAGVVFEDGEVWGVVPPPPPPPPPPPEFKKLELAQETAIQSNTLGESPLSITSGTLKKVKLDPPNQEASATEERYLVRLSVTLINNTPRRITGVAIEYGDPNSEDGLRTYATVKIQPHGTYIFDCPPPEAPGFGAFFARGNQDFKRVSVIGVKFEDGEIWGSIPPPAPPPPPPPVLASGTDNPAKIIRKSGGVLAESATHRVAPESPPLARTARITGSVVVEVTVDEDGAVIAARAISGHPLLKDAAVAAARQWQFTPTMLSGAPVKVIGLLTFNFEP